MSNWKEWCKLCNRCPYLTEEYLKVPFNLTELAKRIEDNEALQKIEFVRYEYERKKE